MNRDDIIRIAWEAGFQVLLPQDHVDGTGGVYVVEDEIAGMLERFAALVAAAAEQPKPEPVGVMQESCVMEGLVIPVVTQELPVGTPLYAALVTAEPGKEIAALTEPVERKPLTDEEIEDIYLAWDVTPGRRIADLARAIERKITGGKK